MAGRARAAIGRTENNGSKRNTPLYSTYFLGCKFKMEETRTKRRRRRRRRRKRRRRKREILENRKTNYEKRQIEQCKKVTQTDR